MHIKGIISLSYSIFRQNTIDKMLNPHKKALWNSEQKDIKKSIDILLRKTILFIPL